MPTLFILAGPNGTGKTTFYNSAIVEGQINKDLPFINVDSIARFELGGYSEESFAKASEIARQRMEEHLNERADFMVESNLAREADYVWIESMKKAGYEVILYFLCTSDSAINIDRVQRRLKEGGHFVPTHMVVDRYNISLTYLRGKLHHFKEAYLIDNSGDTIEEKVFLEDGAIQNESKDLPLWVEKLLYIVRRLKRKE